MTLSIPNLGETHLLKLALGKSRATNLVLHLYSNNVFLANKSVTTKDFLKGNQISSDLFTENGYSSVVLNSANWNVSTIGGFSVAQYNFPIIFTFLNNNVKKIYGYFITASSEPEFEYSDWVSVPYSDDVVGSPIWAESFDNGPYVVPSLGGSITIIPKIKLGSAISLLMTATPTKTPTKTPTLTPTLSLTPTLTKTPTPTASATLTPTPTQTQTSTPTINFSNIVKIIAPTPTLTSSSTPTPPPTSTSTPTPTPTPTVNFSNIVKIIQPTPTSTI